MGTSQAAVASLEAGGVGATITTLQKIAGALDLKVTIAVGASLRLSTQHPLQRVGDESLTLDLERAVDVAGDGDRGVAGRLRDDADGALAMSLRVR